MQKSARGLAAAATLTLTVGLALGSAPAMAAPHGHHATVASHGHAGEHGKAGSHGKGADHKFVNLQKKVVRDAARASRQIGTAVTDQRLAGLDVASVTAVQANAAADQAALQELGAAAAAATSTDDLKPVAATVKSFRQENYRITVNLLRRAADLSTQLAGATAADSNLDATAAEAALADAVAKAQAVVATDAKSVFAPIRADLAAAQAVVDDAATTDPTDPPAPTEPPTPTP